MTRIYVVFAEEPVFHPAILQELLEARGKEIVGVAGVAHRRRNQSRWRYLGDQIAFWGGKGLVLNTAAVAKCRLLDRSPLPWPRGSFHSLRRACAAHRVPYLTVTDVNDRAFLDHLGSLDLDVVVSSQGQIFGEELLALPRVGCINRHSALLPSYGGLRPVFWAMLNGEPEVGVSVHAMQRTIDGGDVLAQTRLPVARGASLYSLYKSIFAASGAAILRAIAVLEGSSDRPEVVRTSSSYFREPSRDDIKRFKSLGHRMI
jgi:methionyl-tRNA formyltransferase